MYYVWSKFGCDIVGNVIDLFVKYIVDVNGIFVVLVGGFLFGNNDFVNCYDIIVVFYIDNF